MQEGSLAADFELEDTTGTVRRLCDFEGRWLLLVLHRHLL